MSYRPQQQQPVMQSVSHLTYLPPQRSPREIKEHRKTLLVTFLVIFLVISGGLTAYHIYRENDITKQIQAFPELQRRLARKDVALFTGIKEIKFTGYYDRTGWGDMTVGETINGADASRAVVGPLYAPTKIKDLSGPIGNPQEHKDGWYLGDKSTGIKFREKKLNENDVSLKGIKITYYDIQRNEIK